MTRLQCTACQPFLYGRGVYRSRREIWREQKAWWERRGGTRRDGEKEVGGNIRGAGKDDGGNSRVRGKEDGGKGRFGGKEDGNKGGQLELIIFGEDDWN